MCSRGRPTQINRSGIESMAADFLHTAAFEAAFQRLSLAAVRGDTSKLSSFSSKFIFGEAANAGVHATRIMIEYKPEVQVNIDRAAVQQQIEQRNQQLMAIVQSDLAHRMHHDPDFYVFQQ